MVPPAVAAGVLEARLRRRVSVHRRLVVSACGHRLLELLKLALERHEVSRSREDVLAQRQVLFERWALVVQRDPRALFERELTAVPLGFAREDAEQGRLAGPVRA